LGLLYSIQFWADLRDYVAYYFI